MTDKSAPASDASCDTAPFFTLSLDMLCLANTEGFFTKVNPAFIETLGWSEEELLSRRFLDFVHPADLDATLAEIASLGLGKRTIGFENRYRCADGSWRWLSWRSIADPATGVIYAVAHDITYLREARDQADRAREAAEVANRSKSGFLANMSHELRTPLNAIIGFSEMLKEDFEDVVSGRVPQPIDLPRTIEDLDKIRGAGRHLLSLINQVLDLSKVEAGQMELQLETLDLAELIDGVQQVVVPLVAANANRLTVALPDDIGRMISDSTKLRQILLNLLGNAAKFTDDGEIRLTLAHDGRDRVRFEVQDNGVGMEPEDIDRLFEPFTQADPSTTREHGGTGLGLSISRRFCELLGGTIGALSSPGEGTSIWFSLPRDPAQCSARPATRARSEGDDGGDVLVIDDDPTACEITLRILHQLGYRATARHSGEAGLAAARAHRPRLILLDVLMPKMDGWAVLHTLQGIPELADVPVVMISVLGRSELGFALGIAGHITKPIDGEVLASTLQRFDVKPGIPEALVVEDHPASRELLVRALQRAGWRARTAADGIEAMAALDQAPTDLVLLDLMMPRMDGFEVLDAMGKRGDLADTPVIVVTARDLTQDDLARLNGSVERVLGKGQDLAAQLRDELARHAPQVGLE